MKKLLFILFLGFTLSMLAQTSVRVIPDEYESTFKEVSERVSEVIPTPDKVILDPIEQTPIPASYITTLSQGNWGYSYYQLDNHFAAITKLAIRPIVVFVFDTGLPDHLGLQEALWTEKHKIFTGEASIIDGNGHGTHVAGIYGAIIDNLNAGLCSALIAAKKLRIVSYKVLRNEGWAYNESISDGLIYANNESKKLISQGYFVIYNLSLGSVGVNSVFDNLIQQAENIGVFVVAASGNKGIENIATPANGISAHAIAALDPAGNRANYSNFGRQMYMSAPGTRIFSTWTNGRWVEISGTSMAAPAQGSIAAIAASIHPHVTNRQISHFLKNHVEDILPDGWDIFTGYGSSIVEKIINSNPEKEPDELNGNPGQVLTPPSPMPTPSPIKGKTPWWVFVLLGTGIGGITIFILARRKLI